MHHSASLFKTIILLSLTVLLTSCSYVIVPQKIPPLKNFADLPLSDVSVALINKEENDSDRLIIHSRCLGTFYGNPRLWTENFIDALSKELVKRGASVESKASL